MKLKGLTEGQLRYIVDFVSETLYDGNIVFKREPERKGNFLHFTLTVRDSAGPGGRRSPAGRRVAALCWHGHRDVMERIFEANPEAILVTAMARYEGNEGFYREYPGTGYTNIGPMMQPMTMQDACEC